MRAHYQVLSLKTGGLMDRPCDDYALAIAVIKAIHSNVICNITQSITLTMSITAVNMLRLG